MQFPARKKWLTPDVSLKPEWPHHGHKQNSITHPKGRSSLGPCRICICKKTFYSSYLKEITWMSTVTNIMVKKKKKKKLSSMPSLESG